MNWDELFGGSTFAYKNIRRKSDGRAFPSRLEFGLKGGIVPPTSINSGEAVERMLGRIAAGYHELESFDTLPTPFRTVAVDLVRARQVVLKRGSLADAMRATMSLPLIFPPVAIDGQVLVDGGAMNNVPADVVKGDGRRPRHRGERRRPDRPRGHQPHAARRGRFHAGRDDALDDPDVARRGRRRHQRAAGELRFARLASSRRTRRGGLQGRRGDARRSCCRWPSARPTTQPGRRRASSAGVWNCRRRCSFASRASATNDASGSKPCSRATSARASTSTRSRATWPS